MILETWLLAIQQQSIVTPPPASLYTWGDNTYGELGLNSVTSFSTPQLVGTSSWSQVTTGGDYAMAIRSDGALFGWGYNIAGQLGDGTVVSRSSPVQIGISSWVQVSSKFHTTIALRADKTLWAWGLNTVGQVGDNSIINRSSPVQIGTSSWTQVSAGTSATYAVRSDGALFAWGYNSYYQLGDGTYVNRSSPVQIGTSSWSQVSGGDSHAVALNVNKQLYNWGSGIYPLANDSFSWKMVSVGSIHTMAIRSDNTLWGWGTNTSGQLGIGTVTGTYINPIQIGTYNSWSQVSAGGSFSAALRADGSIWSWGANVDGELGYGSLATSSSPVQIGTSSWTQVYASGNQMAAIRLDGSVWCWGYGLAGEIGNGAAANVSAPTRIAGTASTSSFVQVSVGGAVAAITITGALWAWGWNIGGQVGNGTQNSGTNISSPVLIGSSSWAVVACGGTHTAAITSTGALFTWGLNNNGQLGSNLPTTSARSSPVQVGTSSWTQVTVGTDRVQALTITGALFAWGLNSSGQLGDGTVIARSSPVQIGLSAGTSYWTKIYSGATQAFGVFSTNVLFAWGLGTSGQLGNITTTSTSSPVQVASVRISPTSISTSSWTQISAGYSHSLGITTTGALFAWGSWQAYPGLYSWTSISTRGQSYAMAIRSDGALFGWGYNGTGQLGDGTVISRSSPVQIGTGSWIMVSIGFQSSAAIRFDGALFAWGNGISGILGQNNQTNYSSPVQIGTSYWSQISVGISNMAAVRGDGSIFTWGDNTWGQIGDGTVIARSSPVQVGLTGNWNSISVGSSHMMAIDNSFKLWSWGDNSGELGLNNLTSRSSPVQVGSSQWSIISAGTQSSAAIRFDGALFTWGANYFGQLGDGTQVNRSSPVQIGTSSWIQVSLGLGVQTGSFPGNACAAIRSDGALFTWGYNGRGTLGDGTVVSRSSPVQIGISSWTQVSGAGYNNSGSPFSAIGAIRNDGYLFLWGDNTYGELGESDVINKSSPVQIGLLVSQPISYSVLNKIGNSSWVQVSAGNNYSEAINTSNAVYGWGVNSNTAPQIGTIQGGPNWSNGGIIIGQPTAIGINATSVSAGSINTVAG